MPTTSDVLRAAREEADPAWLARVAEVRAEQDREMSGPERAGPPAPTSYQWATMRGFGGTEEEYLAGLFPVPEFGG